LKHVSFCNGVRCYGKEEVGTGEDLNNKINQYKMKGKPAAPHGRLLATETKHNIK